MTPTVGKTGSVELSVSRQMVITTSIAIITGGIFGNPISSIIKDSARATVAIFFMSSNNNLPKDYLMVEA